MSSLEDDQMKPRYAMAGILLCVICTAGPAHRSSVERPSSRPWRVESKGVQDARQDADALPSPGGMHCIGSNPAGPDDAWHFRSCLYHNLCMNTSNQEWLLHAPNVEAHAVAAGVTSFAWSQTSQEQLRFLPRVLAAERPGQDSSTTIEINL